MSENGMAPLIDLQDQLDVARNFVACIFMACQSPAFPSDERRALCSVLDAVLEQLASIGIELDALIQAKKGS